MNRGVERICLFLDPSLRPLMTFQPLNINKLPGEKADARKHGADGDLLKDTWRCFLAQVTICI